MSVAPYTASVWKDILACGKAVEASLARSKVLLTMGGEPTFVPTSPGGAEWQTAALGPTKLAYARKLARELVRSAFPGSVILETSGKLFPSEPLPRWTLLLQRRADGTPLWRDIQRLRADTEPGTHTPADAKKFAVALAKSLSVDSTHCLPFAETTAPTEVTGFVLPLDHTGAKWITDDWTPAFRPPSPNAHLPSPILPLFAGESPAGLRLPLAKLGEKNLRRALTAEIRAGALTIFVPPLLLPAYCALLPKIEDTLAALKLSDVVLAGYAPPPDAALPTVGLASDPGVLEINVSPCATWADFDAQLAQLFAAAHTCGLCARKLQFNGRETGTGGGAHLVFGGPAGLLSPFFAFPALLPSVIRCEPVIGDKQSRVMGDTLGVGLWVNMARRIKVRRDLRGCRGAKLPTGPGLRKIPRESGRRGVWGERGAQPLLPPPRNRRITFDEGGPRRRTSFLLGVSGLAGRRRPQGGSGRPPSQR